MMMMMISLELVWHRVTTGLHDIYEYDRRLQFVFAFLNLAESLPCQWGLKYFFWIPYRRETPLPKKGRSAYEIKLHLVALEILVVWSTHFIFIIPSVTYSPLMVHVGCWFQNRICTCVLRSAKDSGNAMWITRVNHLNFAGRKCVDIRKIYYIESFWLQGQLAKAVSQVDMSSRVKRSSVVAGPWLRN